ncbi:MAG: NAD(P)/FAD-dependent oxidoreductase [Deltaproteobacteria bacterium]|nr:NAD(P)/FAD-dependent oxidoreductase [Deltaproteobacteria bacterium]
MAEPDVIVVGGGIGGLTCAAFLARQGLEVLLLERDDRLGGLARSVKVGDRLIPANWARSEGFYEDDPKVRILEHLGVLSRLAPEATGTVCEVRSDDGLRVVVPAGPEPACDALVEAFPEEERRLRRVFTTLARLTLEVERLGDDTRSAVLRVLGFPLFYPTLFRHRGRTAAEYLDSAVRLPRARAVLAALGPAYGSSPTDHGFTAWGLSITAALRRPVRLPGGGRRLAQLLGEVLRERGTVRTRTPVTGVLTDGRRLLGVRTADEELRARVVVLNVPARVAFGSLVPREAVHAGYLQRIAQLRPSASACVLLLAVRAPRAALDARADYLVFPPGDDLAAHARALDEESVAGRPLTAALHGPEAGADEVTLVTATVPDRLARWAALDPDARAALAVETRATLLARLAPLLPDLERRLEADRLLTPLDLAEWSGDPDGSLFGWEPTPEQSGSRRLEARTPVDGLLLAGAWTQPGAGYGGTLLSGFLTGLQAAMHLGRRVRM